MIGKDNWGWRARFGMFIVASEAVPEAEWWAMMPPGMSVHASRISASAPWAKWADDGHAGVLLADDLASGAAHFATMQLNAVVLGHSSSSILGGPGWDAAVVTALRELLPAQTPVTTNGLDCQAALRVSGISNPFLVFPPWFGQDLVDAGIAYFKAAGFSPAGALSTDPGRQWRDLPRAELYPQGMGFEQDVESFYRQIRDAVPDAADGVLIAGTGFRCVGIINTLEQDLRRPVITANQASLWRCMQLAGVNSDSASHGSLFRER